MLWPRLVQKTVESKPRRPHAARRVESCAPRKSDGQKVTVGYVDWSFLQSSIPPKIATNDGIALRKSRAHNITFLHTCTRCLLAAPLVDEMQIQDNEQKTARYEDPPTSYKMTTKFYFFFKYQDRTVS